MINVENILSSPIISNPWKYKEISNALSIELFNKLSTEISNIDTKEIPCNENGIWLCEALRYGFSDELISDIFEANKQFLQLSKDLINQFSTDNVSQIGYFSIPRFNFVKQGYNGEIHNDADVTDKSLIMTVYLHPEQAEGTRLYSTEDESSYTGSLNWKKNNAFMFAPLPDKTWHSFNSYNDERITLGFFLEKMEHMNFINRVSEERFEWFYSNFSKDTMSIMLN